MDLSTHETRRLIPFLKRRMYRFSDDLRQHAVAEILEDRVREGIPLTPETLAAAASALVAQTERGTVELDAEAVARQEGVDLHAELSRRRAAVTPAGARLTPPQRVVVILGAPRSGTSHLFNLLAWVTDWAVLTDASHHVWTPWSLPRAMPRFLRYHPARVLEQDNREMKLDPGICQPSEAENVLARAIPVYEHLRGHVYRLQPARLADAPLLRRVGAEHTALFGSGTLLVKSPFNVFRAALLPQAFGVPCSFLHIVRDGHEAGQSIGRQGFVYWHDGRELRERQAWQLFVEHADAVPSLRVDFAELRSDPEATVARVLEQLETALSRPFPISTDARHPDSRL